MLVELSRPAIERAVGILLMVSAVVCAIPACSGRSSTVTLNLRIVEGTSSPSTDSVCGKDVATLATAGPEELCALDGSTVYSLGPSLGVINPDSASVSTMAETAQPMILINLKADGARRLSAVSQRFHGQVLAVVLARRVISAATLQGPLSDSLQLFPPPPTARRVAKALHARGT